MNDIKWSENVILVDGDYVNKVVFDLIVNFERMLMRRIPNADLAKWLECIALDGHIKPDEKAETQVIFIYDKDKLSNFIPNDYEQDINGKAFRSSLGEFAMSAYPVEDIVGKDEFFLQILSLLKQQKEVKRIMLIPNIEHYINKVKAIVDELEEKTITLFSMQPILGGNFQQEILGYSLMNALGIHADELERLKD